MINKKYEFVLFAFFMAAFMVGFVEGIFWYWLEAYWKAFLVAFPTIFIVVPQVRKVVALFIKD